MKKRLSSVGIYSSAKEVARIIVCYRYMQNEAKMLFVGALLLLLLWLFYDRNFKYCPCILIDDGDWCSSLCCFQELKKLLAGLCGGNYHWCFS